jgi:DNA-binding MurR/RpiR family transcriptional regulator
VKPSNENLTPKQEAALVALLANGTVEQAYTAAGVSKATMWRFLQLPEFQARYKTARRELVDGAVALLQRGATQAARVLVEIAEDKQAPASSRVMAAKAILDQANASIEREDLLERIERLEELLSQHEGKRTWASSTG